jgi:hypothetical protein
LFICGTKKIAQVKRVSIINILLNKFLDDNLLERKILDKETTMLYPTKKSPIERSLSFKKRDKKFMITPKPEAKRKLANRILKILFSFIIVKKLLVSIRSSLSSFSSTTKNIKAKERQEKNAA